MLLMDAVAQFVDEVDEVRLEGGGELLLVQLCWPADGGWPLAGQ